jgi:hypothetical protein
MCCYGTDKAEFVKVTPHDESPFQENARRALNFKVSPLKFGIHNDKSLLLLLL